MSVFVGFSEDVTAPLGGVKTKGKVQAALHDETLCVEEALDRGCPGSRSWRALTSTQARKSGCSKEEKDLQGWWKRCEHASDARNGVNLPFLDAKVAGKCA